MIYNFSCITFSCITITYTLYLYAMRFVQPCRIKLNIYEYVRLCSSRFVVDFNLNIEIKTNSELMLIRNNDRIKARRYGK